MNRKKLFAGLVAVGVVFLLTAVRAEETALPEFDAATITGDELVGLLTNREVQLTSEDYAALNAALKGRELTFHDFCVYGCCRSHALNGEDRWYGLELSTFREHQEYPGGWVEWDNRFNLSLGFSDADDIRFARRIWGANHRCGFGVIKTLSGVVETDFHFGSLGGLQLKATDLEPREPIEELPNFDAQTMTGDELAELCKKLKQGLTQNVYEELNEQLLGRELTFSDVQVLTVHEDEDGFTDVECGVAVDQSRTMDVRDRCLRLVARLKTKDIEALPWSFAGGMAIKRLTGHVSEAFGSTVVGIRETLTLADAKAEVAWKDEKLPSFDAETLTGDGLVELLTASNDGLGFAKLQRICRALKGRRLTFSEGEVLNCRKSWQNEDIFVSLGFGPKRGRFGAFPFPPVAAVFPAGEAAKIAAQLTNGQKLRNISGVFALNETPPKGRRQVCNGVTRWYLLTDVTFDAPKASPLPDFDEKTVTGDELVKLMLGLRQKELSIAQWAELRTRLAGRRLTFHKAWQGDASGDINGWKEVTFRFCLYDDVREGKACEFSVRATLRTPEPWAKPQDEPRWGSNWTVEGTVEPPKMDGLRNDENVFALTDAVIKWEPTD